MSTFAVAGVALRLLKSDWNFMCRSGTLISNLMWALSSPAVIVQVCCWELNISYLEASVLSIMLREANVSLCGSAHEYTKTQGCVKTCLGVRSCWHRPCLDPSRMAVSNSSQCPLVHSLANLLRNDGTLNKYDKFTCGFPFHPESDSLGAKTLLGQELRHIWISSVWSPRSVHNI